LRRQRRDADCAGEPVDTDLWAAVKGLTERQRTVVALRYVADLKERDIAEVLGISRSTVSTTLRDAHARLAGVLATDAPSHAEEENDHARPA
jgi:DNA-directed RNA polymerase specialized sigma24 family protein